MNKKVGIVRCASYDPEETYKALKQAVELSGDLDVAGKTVLLKPNIVFDSSPEKAVCTHPVFLEAAARLVREMGARRILAGDSPGLQGHGFSAKASGLGEAARKSGAEWVDFTADKIDLPCPDGKVMKKFTVTSAVSEADVIVSLPKLKTHQLMYYTGALKNTFGLVPSVAKSTFHVRFSGRQDFAAMIVDLNLAVKPHYALMDAITGMEGPGPSAGTPRHIGLILASSNFLAMDLAASEVIGYPPLGIPVNSDALSRGYWLSAAKEIEYPGLSPSELRISGFIKIPLKKSDAQLLDFILPRPLKKMMELFAPWPKIDSGICVSCGDCAKICASTAISKAPVSAGSEKNKMIIDYSRCIRCFCCHEICPAKAIDITKRKPRNH